MADFNTQIIDEFRQNDGQVGGNFAGSPITLLHHTGRKSGREFVAPVMYLADEQDPKTIFVFASKAGAPTNPEWYYNLTASGTGRAEIGSETHDVSVEELTGTARDEVYAEQARRYPGFAEYEEKVGSARTIPVLALHLA